MSALELRVLPDAGAVADAAADVLAVLTGQVALAGGSTPKAAYKLAAERIDDWETRTFWLGDERVVPPGDVRSNLRMAQAQLGGAARIEPVATHLGPVAAAADYETRLRAALGDGALDLVLLGLGPDSHTASLFPGKPALEVRDRWVCDVPEAGMEPQVPRVTLTLPAINAAREVVFLVAGADKAQAMARAFGDPPDASAPAALVRPSRRLLVLCDEASAARL